MASISKKSIISKESVALTLDCYKTPNTIPLVFVFEPEAILDRSLSLKSYSLDGKSLLALNSFFTEEEGQELREFSKAASFSQKIFGSQESAQYGEVPAKMMNGKERWQFFANPPSAIHSLFRLFSFLSHRIDVKIMTLPWCLSDQQSSSNCFATNFINENSKMSQDNGKHQDYNPVKGLAFSIPSLYDREKLVCHDRFVNGEVGKPLMITVMVYATADSFLSEYGMGTLFYSRDGKEIAINCRHMQIVMFEGDILHTIEESKTPNGVRTWRVSYVFKIILNPKREDQTLRQALFNELKKLEDITSVKM